MSLSSRELVSTFYEANLIYNEDIVNNYLHPEVILHWNSSSGVFDMSFSEIRSLLKGMRDAFEYIRSEISHIVVDKDTVSIRHSIYSKLIENQSEEVIGDFMCIWEIKDHKLHRGYMMSQYPEESKKNLTTFI